jgi:hypothetical protein
VYQDIPHARDVDPRNRGGERVGSGRNVSNGLADDFEVANDGVHRLLICFELFEGEVLNVPFDLRNRVEDVLYAQPPFSLGGKHRLGEDPIAELRLERRARDEFNLSSDPLAELTL